MQKLINVLAIASFGVSAAVVAAGVYVYVNKDAMVDAAIDLAVEAAIDSIPIPGIGALGGDAIPSPTGGGGGLPPITLPF